MKHNKTITALILIGALVCVNACQTPAGDSSESQARISKSDATKTALTKVPNGTVKEAELEKENGKLIWSFDISTPGTKDITEVNVDAVTGALVGVTVESAKDEAKEAKDEKK